MNMKITKEMRRIRNISIANDRENGMSYKDIAKKYGFNSKSAPHYIVRQERRKEKANKAGSEVLLGSGW